MSNHAEFLKLLLRHQADIKAFIGSLVRNRQDRDDVFQDVVLVLWEKFDQYDPTRSFGAWARGIASNKVLQSRDRLGKAPTPFSPEAITAILDAFQRREEQSNEAIDALEKCMEPLPERSRRILTLRYGESCSVQQIADQIGISTSAAFKALSRLRTKLYECVKRRLSSGEEGAR